MRLFFVEVQVPPSPLSHFHLGKQESGGLKKQRISSKELHAKLVDVQEILLLTTR